MPTTPILALPYPAPGDTPDVPYWLQQLAERVEAVRTGAMGVPVTTAASGTPTVAATETRDAVLGNYTFTAVAGRRYRVVIDGLVAQGTVVADRFTYNIRNGGAATPTAASTLVATAVQVGVVAAAAAGNVPVPLAGTFVPGAGVVTLSMFAVRAVGTGIITPVGTREFYCIDLGPST